jgi:uncharacterized RDD family membrane protein YckC
MEKDYPVLLKRIQAVMVDVLFLLIAMMVISQLLGLFTHVAEAVRISLFVFLFLFYDPLLTSFLGGTLGHLVIGIRVKKESTEITNISLFAALLRFIIKSTLGWISLLTVTGNKRKRALHDLLSGSVVICK